MSYTLSVGTSSFDVLSSGGVHSAASAVPVPHISGKRASAHKSDLRHRRGARKSALAVLGFSTYSEYLRSPHWRRLRIRYQNDESLPQACVCGDTQIQLHHTTYERVGRELLTDLTPLCARCHALVHVLERRGDIGIDLDGLFDDQRAAGYRARLEEIADRLALEDEQTVALDAEYIAGLPLDDLLIEAQRRGIDVSGELRVIRQRLDRMRGKLDAAATRTRIVA